MIRRRKSIPINRLPSRRSIDLINRNIRNIAQRTLHRRWWADCGVNGGSSCCDSRTELIVVSERVFDVDPVEVYYQKIAWIARQQTRTSPFLTRSQSDFSYRKRVVSVIGGVSLVWKCADHGINAVPLQILTGPRIQLEQGLQNWTKPRSGKSRISPLKLAGC
ncbi:hypothetical protein G7K_1008-t1 [Saitoella complicata NRRL Y-17804]|uniref:Uncharacterized protein n=1 Tax=Saitoella complicata (strain BCRC 22490 / CBS 7301 / JCM 7358 / NBRC 10748 / NRRL Y-17804) TaxID=698492 RepID=A0A0E9NAD2_SAICN|nr:hypothetical protein G7K_1008-t1 [Saitoella complicata NRRL Y-17804]